MLGNKPFVALCGARAVSSIGDQVAAVALVLLIARDHTPTAVGGLLLAESLPMLLSAHAGIVADRIEGRRLMIGLQLGQAAIFGLVTLWLPPYWALLALIASASWLGTILRSATQTTIRDVVPRESLQPANALLGLALWGGMMLGPAIGGALAATVGTRAALAVDTATFLISAGTLLLLPLLPRHAREDTDTGGVRAALRFAMADPILRSLLFGMTMLVAFAGVDNVATVFLVRDTLGQSGAAYGLAMTVFGIGMVAGSALVVRYTEWRAERMMLGTYLATAASATLLGIAPSMAIVYPAQLIGGAANGMDVAAQTTLTQRRTPVSMLGRMAGAMNSAVAVGFLVAYIGGGALVQATSPRTAFLIAAAGTMGAVFVIRPIWSSVPATAST